MKNPLGNRTNLNDLPQKILLLKDPMKLGQTMEIFMPRALLKKKKRERESNQKTVEPNSWI